MGVTNFLSTLRPWLFSPIGGEEVVYFSDVATDELLMILCTHAHEISSH